MAASLSGRFWATAPVRPRADPADFDAIFLDTRAARTRFVEAGYWLARGKLVAVVAHSESWWTSTFAGKMGGWAFRDYRNSAAGSGPERGRSLIRTCKDCRWGRGNWLTPTRKPKGTMMQPIAYVEFADGAMRPVFQDDHGQYVLAGDGEPINGVWFAPRQAWDAMFSEQPIIVNGTGADACAGAGRCSPKT